MKRKFTKLIMLSILFSVLLTSCVNDKDKEVETRQTSATEKAETSEATTKQTTDIQTETAQQETVTQSANTSQTITTTENTEVITQKITTIKNNEDETTSVIVKPEKPVITADAQYDIDNNVININWNSRNPNGHFEVLASTDGINYQSEANVNNQNSYMLPLSGYYELMHIKVKQIVDIDVTAESNVVIIRNINNNDEENLFNDQEFSVNLESDLKSLEQINHSSTIKLLYSINCWLENVENYKVTCSYSNACLLSEKVQYVSVDNPTFEVSCTSLKNGRGIVTVKVEAVTDSGNIKADNAQKIYIIATDTYDYIDINDFDLAEKNCAESQFKNNEINALEYAQRIQSLPYACDYEYLNQLITDYIVTHVDESIKIYGEDYVNYFLENSTDNQSNSSTVRDAS